MSTNSTNSTKRRTILSFAVFFAFIAGLVGAWYGLNHSEDAGGAPKPIRFVFELNEKIWKSFASPARMNTCHPPEAGKVPRVNGEIGLESELPKNWSLTIQGDSDDPAAQPVQITLQDIKALPRTEYSTEFKCIEGWSEPMSFAGVKFSDFMKAYNLKPRRFVGLQTPDGEYYVSIDMDSMMHDQTLLAYEMNGEPLRPGNGAPLRLVIPIKYGIKNLKRIGKIVFSDDLPPDYWAERGYDWYAGL
jgi:hypothetical protein